MPTLVHSSTITLDFPPTSPTTSITLKSPLMDNEHSLQITRVLRKSRGLTQSIFRDPTWPKIEMLTWTIADLTKVERDDFLSFLTTSLGKQVRLTDFESRQWDGLIIGDESSNVRASCGYTVSFTFEGTLV